MRRRFLFLIVAVFAVSVLSADENFMEPEEKTGVYVSCNVYGASVYIDGNYRGLAPLSITDIEPGKHRLEVSKAHHSSDISYIVVEEGFIREAKCTIEKISGQVTVLSNQPDVKVYCDGDLTGDKNVELDEGIHTITVKKFGFKPASDKINVKRNSSYSIEIKMEPAEFDIVSFDSGKTIFNPKDYKPLANIEFNISVTAPGSGTVEITSETGEVVYTADIDFVTWDQKLKWNGTDAEDFIVEDGLYTATLNAGGKSASYIFVLDSRIVYPMLTATPSGLGIGPVATAQLYPKSTLFLGFESGAFFKADDTVFYGVPINASLSWTPTKYFELTGNFFGTIHDGMKFGVNVSAKLAGTSTLGAEQICYGAFLRLGESSSPVFPPYGYDSGRGLGGGLLLGYLINDFYLGIETTYLFRPVMGVFSSEGDDSIWKSGLLISKSFDSGSLSLYASISTGFGTFKKDGETVDLGSGLRTMEFGGRFAFYLLGKNLSAGLEGGVIIYPKDENDVLASDNGATYPYAKLGVTWTF